MFDVNENDSSLCICLFYQNTLRAAKEEKAAVKRMIENRRKNGYQNYRENKSGFIV